MAVFFALQPTNVQERIDVIYIQEMKKDAYKEIIRLKKLIEEHNNQCVCNKEACRYAG